MANPEHVKELMRGVAWWNEWRRFTRTSVPSPDLSGANLSYHDLGGANFSRVDFRRASFHESDMRGANLSGAVLDESDLRGQDLSGVDLCGAHLRLARLSSATLIGVNLTRANLFGALLVGSVLIGANLNRAVLSRANLVGAALSRANLREADLSETRFDRASLIDARLDGANLTDARLWETQREGWSIKGVTCQRAFWDREGKEAKEYAEGEFERFFAEKPRIVLRYPDRMSPIDLIALPAIVEDLQTKYPDTALEIRSVQNGAGGASVVIMVDDLKSRGAKAFKLQLLQMKTKLEDALEDRDYYRQLIRDALTKVRQEIHYHQPRGRIEGPIMSRDTYNVGQGIVGPGAHGHDNTFQQIQAGGIDLPKLVEELGRLRTAMKGETTGTREEDKAIGAVADAEEAAAKGDGLSALSYLKSAGMWTIKVAEKIGVPLATEVLKKAMIG
jgi:uncharacterized protein YjbI with pentapeptide repeats